MNKIDFTNKKVVLRTDYNVLCNAETSHQHCVLILH